MLSEFKISNLRIVSYSDTWNHHKIERKCNIIFELDNSYYYLIENMDKLVDVSNMPDYLQTEWFKYNKNILTEGFTKSELDKQLDVSQKISSEKTNEIVLELKSILRSFQIGKII